MSQLPLEGVPAGRTTEAAALDAVQVRELQPADFYRWDEFVSNCSSFDFGKNRGFERLPLALGSQIGPHIVKSQG